jgi:hypothetical protein
MAFGSWFLFLLDSGDKWTDITLELEVVYYLEIPDYLRYDLTNMIEK